MINRSKGQVRQTGVESQPSDNIGFLRSNQ